MKLRNLMALLTICLCFTAAGQSNGTYSVTIVQGDLRYELSSTDTLIQLKPQPFHFEIEIKEFPGIFVNAHTFNEYYALTDAEVWPNFEYLASMVPAEDAFNVNQDLYFGSTSFCYWNYKKENDWYRFDEGLKTRGNKISGTYTVKTLFHQDTKTYTSLQDFDETLYILFFTANFSENWTPDYPANRKRVRIQFN